MAGGHRVKRLRLRVGAKHPELDLPVAHDVRIGCQSVGVFIEQVIHHKAAVVAHQVDNAKLDADLLRHGARVLDVLLPGAIAGEGGLLDPVLHVGADDLAALLLQKERGNAAVDPAGHGDQNPHDEG